MNTPINPSKYEIRAYLARRLKEHCPPPTVAEIRRQLGWQLQPLMIVPCVTR